MKVLQILKHIPLILDLIKVIELFLVNIEKVKEKHENK
jgi:hypothetical protein